MSVPLPVPAVSMAHDDETRSSRGLYLYSQKRQQVYPSSSIGDALVVAVVFPRTKLTKLSLWWALRVPLTPQIQTVQEAVAGSVEDMLSECHCPSVLRAATVSLTGSKKGGMGGERHTAVEGALELSGAPVLEQRSHLVSCQ